MENEQLKQENEGLKAQILGLSFNLQQADKQIVVLQNELERYYNRRDNNKWRFRLFRFKNKKF